MKYLIAKNSKFISLTVTNDTEESLSWEQLQEIKDRYFPGLNFIEVYPKKDQIINKANERHLIHIKDWQCPMLSDLEIESDIEIITER